MEIYRSYTLKIDGEFLKLMRGNKVLKTIKNDDIEKVEIITDSSLKHKYLGLLFGIALLATGCYWLSKLEFQWAPYFFLRIIVIPFIFICCGIYLLYSYVRKSHYLMIFEKNNKQHKVLIDDGLDGLTIDMLQTYFHALNIRSSLQYKR